MASGTSWRTAQRNFLWKSAQKTIGVFTRSIGKFFPPVYRRFIFWNFRPRLAQVLLMLFFFVISNTRTRSKQWLLAYVKLKLGTNVYSTASMHICVHLYTHFGCHFSVPTGGQVRASVRIVGESFAPPANIPFSWKRYAYGLYIVYCCIIVSILSIVYHDCLSGKRPSGLFHSLIQFHKGNLIWHCSLRAA